MHVLALWRKLIRAFVARVFGNMVPSPADIEPAANCFSHFLHVTAKMASRLPKLSLDVYFCTLTDKDTFMLRLKRIHERLTPPGGKLLSYRDHLLRMFDAVEEREATQATKAAEMTSMLRSNGKCWFHYTVNEHFCGYEMCI